EHIRARYGDSAAENAAVFEDEGFSGGNLNRPGYQRMMKAAHEGKFRAIVVYRLDRISRNISDFSALIEELSRLDVDFVSIREQFDTGSPMGRAMMYISSVFSQLERETIAERIRDNMRELAKTGRWLGGATPTGYASESVRSVSVDGKTRKMCQLKLIPEEAEIVRDIYRLFAEYDSLTAVETELLRRQSVTKTGKNFTRFSIKNILQNPVYLTADADAYRYFADRQAEIFSDLSAFDGLRGILAYNRTDQEKGRAAIPLPVNEWIITVGQHPGIIPAKTWIQVQESLERNKSKGYRKPRSNEALLTGLLFCRCGSRMYPKLTKRMTADGKPIYTYVCKMKERSQRSRCNLRNANGNALDEGIIEEIKKLSGDDSHFIEQLEKSKRFYTGSRGQYDATLDELRKEYAENEKKITGLADSLADLGDGAARKRVAARIEELSRAGETLRVRIGELEGLTEQKALSDMEFDLMRQLLTNFRDSIDAMSVAEKRAAVRTLIRKVIWDGEFAHVILFGASEDEIEYPDLQPLISAATDADGGEESDAETLLCEDSE
ncbi:MAG: recombinase family protein, partial [Oscillibacter sp.]|nr:recombinase family protein [Oscillibacter sp.]